MSKNKPFTFIDLFAGIGGFHIAMHNLGGKCVFASEIDLAARKTYEHNFKKGSPHLFQKDLFNEDIRAIAPEDMPDFDLLCAGFPCQPFSQAGQKRGFSDSHKSERGNLFFNVAEIIEAKRPKAFFLENVRGLIKHDNGNTFQTIRNILEKELGYSFFFKVVKAVDYGLPQLRPRVFIIGFRKDVSIKEFVFPPSVPLKFTMSDVWKGNCSRDVGFTIRVGGRGSNINDRRNWDSYLVDGVVRRLGFEEGLIMQGFPEDYEFPVSPTQAIKQLGNSVAVDAIQSVASEVVKQMNETQDIETTDSLTYNKGEWSELLVLLQLLTEQKLSLSDSELKPVKGSFVVHKVTTHNLDREFAVVTNMTIKSIIKSSKKAKDIDISNLLTKDVLLELKNNIISGSGSFSVSGFDVIQSALGFSLVKGGNSYQKADIILDISNEDLSLNNEGFGIKSFLGKSPTLLNASGNTNFVFAVTGLGPHNVDEVNSINTRTKIIDRLTTIEELGGELTYVDPERPIMGYNLSMIDSAMSLIIGEILLTFYKKRINRVSEIIEEIHKSQNLNKLIQYPDEAWLQEKVKRLLISVLLGFFPGRKWNGNFESNGTIVMKNTGEMVGFHVVDQKSLKEYLYRTIKLDTPSTTKHRFGSLYAEKNGKLFFKLNLHLRH